MFGLWYDTFDLLIGINLFHKRLTSFLWANTDVFLSNMHLFEMNHVTVHLVCFLCSSLSHKYWKQLSTCCLNALSRKIQHIFVMVLPQTKLKAHELTTSEKLCKKYIFFIYITWTSVSFQLSHTVLPLCASLDFFLNPLFHSAVTFSLHCRAIS